ncbi:MAG: ABC transporter permease [Candidatus Verstraetearchaeota archaeon]|nr:ABC transporter permease [Candidatus Verstraetearchaeota archaeon]
MMEWALILGFIAAGIRTASPLLLASLGETVVQRGGILNLGIEGAMLMGAFSGFMGAYLTGNLWVGLLTSIIAGVLTVLIFGFLVIRINLDQVVSGLAINLLAMGLCLYFFRIAFSQGAFPYLGDLIGPYAIPGLSQIPVLGEVLFNQTVFVYIGLIAVPLIYFLIFKTSFGLRLRSIGEDPVVASYLGINVSRIRYLSLIIEGALVGMAGGLLTISMFNVFDSRIVAARGFVAVSIVILGRWNPWGALGGSLLFGFTEALSLWIGTFLVGPAAPSVSLLLRMLPYVVTILALLVGGRKVRGPAALGSPFSKE